ncbi:MAG: hypothetical protein P4M09_16080 [Devosia sp.]|nr:hypothetical protein [Devosia sp.]
MNYAKMQFRAAATAFVVFAVASLLLFLLVRGVGNVAAALPLPKPLPPYSPGDTIGALLNLKPVVALAAATLLAVAVVLIIRNAFLDRAVHMFISMLTLLLASSIGVIVGFGAYLSIMAHNLVVPVGVVPAAICFGVLLLVSFISLDGLRRSLLTRMLLVPVLTVGAPILLIFAS